MRYPRYASAVGAMAVGCLVGACIFAPAKADTFDFSFGGTPCVNGSPPCASGTFTTGGAAADPGFELITGLTFNVLQGEDDSGFPFFVANLVGKDFAPGAAFNPTTDAFINHGGGGAEGDIGVFELTNLKTFGSIDGESFAEGSDLVSGVLSFNDGLPDTFGIDGRLDIRREIAQAPVPEASTWAMMLIGFACLGFAARRRRLAAVLRPEQASCADGAPCHLERYDWRASRNVLRLRSSHSFGTVVDIENRLGLYCNSDGLSVWGRFAGSSAPHEAPTPCFLLLTRAAQATQQLP